MLFLHWRKQAHLMSFLIQGKQQSLIQRLAFVLRSIISGSKESLKVSSKGRPFQNKASKPPHFDLFFPFVSAPCCMLIREKSRKTSKGNWPGRGWFTSFLVKQNSFPRGPKECFQVRRLELLNSCLSAASVAFNKPCQHVLMLCAIATCNMSVMLFFSKKKKISATVHSSCFVMQKGLLKLFAPGTSSVHQTSSQLLIRLSVHSDSLIQTDWPWENVLWNLPDSPRK